MYRVTICVGCLKREWWRDRIQLQFPLPLQPAGPASGGSVGVHARHLHGGCYWEWCPNTFFWFETCMLCMREWWYNVRGKKTPNCFLHKVTLHSFTFIFWIWNYCYLLLQPKQLYINSMGLSLIVSKKRKKKRKNMTQFSEWCFHSERSGDTPHILCFHYHHNKMFSSLVLGILLKELHFRN